MFCIFLMKENFINYIISIIYRLNLTKKNNLTTEEYPSFFLRYLKFTSI